MKVICSLQMGVGSGNFDLIKIVYSRTQYVMKLKFFGKSEGHLFTQIC